MRHDMSQLSQEAPLSALDAAAELRIVALEVHVPHHGSHHNLQSALSSRLPLPDYPCDLFQLLSI